jgi:putative peptide zinc metalloprotease protein
MNLAEVLNVALPELPARRVSKDYPRLSPKVIAREQIEGGVPTVVSMVSGGSYILRFTPEQWKLVQLFNGKRSYAEIAEQFRMESGTSFTEKEVQEFAEPLGECEFWHKTTLDITSTGAQKMADERRRHSWKDIDLSCLTFSTWDPDRYLTRLHDRLSFIYTRWFTLLTLGAFAITALIFVSGWREILRDTLQYYTFSDKNAGDLAEFWLLFCGLGYFHECAHGLTCKHFGGAVHSMGFMLVYLSPAFFCDVGEVYVYGGKWPRITAIFAGIWVELMFCSVASIVWWGTPPGSPVHDFAYKIMLITGVAVILMNLNPLIKLDGYYLFSELIGMPTIKEDSTEYLSSWVKRHVFRMPVDVPYVRLSRRALFAIYAPLSGVYSYFILFVAVRFAYNVLNILLGAQVALLGALALAGMILRTRLRSSGRFMKDFYLDKLQSVRATLRDKPAKFAAVSAACVLVLCAPVWRETVSGRFVLEAAQYAMIRATVPGRITEVLAAEGSAVTVGDPLLVLHNARLETEADAASFRLHTAEAKAREAQMTYTNLGSASAERLAQAGRSRSVAEQVAALRVTSPISGVVATPRLKDRLGSFVSEGEVLARVNDDRTLIAQIFIPEFQVRGLQTGDRASLKPESTFVPIRGFVSSLAPASSAPPSGLYSEEASEKKYKGIAPPSYYVVKVAISNPEGILRSGMSGDAKIQISRQSIAGFLFKATREALQRRIW